MIGLPDWAVWRSDGAAWSLGIEEEVMLLDPATWRLAYRIDHVLPALPREVGDAVSAETHGAALEIATRPHDSVAGAVGELGALRGGLATALEDLGLRAAVAGTHPTAQWQDTRIASGARYQAIHDSMRELARREPTFALHVHVGVPDPEAALRALVRLREHLPALVALSANSPYWQGRDSGLACARLPVFGAFPRTGIPRRFRSYDDYVDAIDVLLRCEAFPEPTFLWWDLRLQPVLGTIEIRILDAQTHLADIAGLVALVQCLVRHEALDGPRPADLVDHPEVLEENRFLATRDGLDAEVLDPGRSCRRPMRDVIAELLETCAPHADALGCAEDLQTLDGLRACPGYARQRALARDASGPDPLAGMTGALSAAFTADAAPLVA